jgi:hypothetical protein
MDRWALKRRRPASGIDVATVVEGRSDCGAWHIDSPDPIAGV